MPVLFHCTKRRERSQQFSGKNYAERKNEKERLKSPKSNFSVKNKETYTQQTFDLYRRDYTALVYILTIKKFKNLEKTY